VEWFSRIRAAALSAVGIVACSSDSPPPASYVQSNKANPCAVPGANYLVVHVEKSGGTCGPIPDELVHVLDDGTLPGRPMACQSISLTGCTAKLTDCGVDGGFTATTSITFASDGSSANGVETRSRTSEVSIANCTSTYTVTWTRPP